MIIVTSNSGQLGNRLVIFAHCIATGIQASQRVWFFFGHDVFSYANPDESIGREHGIRCFNFTGKKIVAFLLLAFKQVGVYPYSLENRTHYLTENQSRIKRICSQKWFKINLIHNWYFRNNEALVRYRSVICSYLSVRPEYVLAPSKIISELRQKVGVIVGVHIRRGDYKKFYNGRFYYSNEQYAGFMRQVRDILGRETVFLAVSNERVDLNYFASKGLHVYASSGHMVEDLVCLSMCDYIMGPPSTYSWWAAFSGDIPYFTIWDPSNEIGMSSFKRIQGDEFHID